MTVYGPEVRMRAADLFEQRWGYRPVAKKLGIPLSTVKEWQRIFRAVGQEALLDMGSHRAYGWETKVLAAKAVVEDGIPKPQVMARFGIASISPLNVWCRKYREGGAEALRPKPKGRPKGTKAKAKPKTREQQLEREVQRLEAQVAYLKKSIALKAELGLLAGQKPRP